MKTTLLTILLALFVNLSISAQAKKDDIVRETGKNIVDFKVKVKNYANKPVVLGYYFNSKMLVKDTVFTDKNCVASFQRDTLLDEGLYIIHFPENGNLFDVIMPHEQKFVLECDTLPKAAERVTVKNSQVLTNFFAYQNNITRKQQEYGKLMTDFRLAGSDEVKKAEVRAKFNEIDSIVKLKNEQIIEENKGNFLSTFVRALKEIQVPKFDMPESYTKAQRDSAQQIRGYYYYREHFYDNYDLTDGRLLRTPFFSQKIDKYFKETVPQIPDTVATEAIRLIEMCRGSRELFRFFVSTLYNMVNQSKIMGMDAALVAIADKYYLSGEADWVDAKFLDDLRENVDGIRYTLVGLKAPDLKMPSVDGQWFRLSEVQASYTVLVFWEPSCGHCKKEVPKMKKTLLNKYQDYGLKVFAVYCQVEEEPWKKFIEEHELEDFINVYDPYGRTAFRKYYHIKSTPTIFVLDKNKTIVAKKLDVEQIDDFLAHEYGIKSMNEEAK